MSEGPDTLVRATRAVRETYDGTSAQAEATRRSLLLRATVARRRQRKVVVYLLPLAAALALSTAWAAVTGHLWRDGRPHPRSLSSAPATGPDRRAEPEAVGAAPSVSSVTDGGVTDGGATDEGATATRSEDDLALPAAAPRLSGTTHPRVAPPARSSVPSARAAPDAEEALYATAHRRHFVERDPAEALKGWDAYLAKYPNGRFALEARYNRALSLVRLDRRDDARAALAPFANGTYGGYREREARELFDALQSAP